MICSFKQSNKQRTFLSAEDLLRIPLQNFLLFFHQRDLPCDNQVGLNKHHLSVNTILGMRNTIMKCKHKVSYHSLSVREKNSSPIGKVRDVAVKVEISLIVCNNNYATL